MLSSIHGITGVIAILLMLIHAIWATAVLVSGNEKAQQIKVLEKGCGLEALRIWGRGIQPDQENSIWFQEFSDDSYDEAIAWLKEREDGPYVYEFFFS